MAANPFTRTQLGNPTHTYRGYGIKRPSAAESSTRDTPHQLTREATVRPNPALGLQLSPNSNESGNLWGSAPKSKGDDIPMRSGVWYQSGEVNIGNSSPHRKPLPGKPSRKGMQIPDSDGDPWRRLPVPESCRRVFTLIFIVSAMTCFPATRIRRSQPACVVMQVEGARSTLLRRMSN